MNDDLMRAVTAYNSQTLEVITSVDYYGSDKYLSSREKARRVAKGRVEDDHLIATATTRPEHCEDCGIDRVWHDTELQYQCPVCERERVPER